MTWNYWKQNFFCYIFSSPFSEFFAIFSIPFFGWRDFQLEIELLNKPAICQNYDQFSVLLYSLRQKTRHFSFGGIFSRREILNQWMFLSEIYIWPQRPTCWANEKTLNSIEFYSHSVVIQYWYLDGSQANSIALLHKSNQSLGTYIVCTIWLV